MSRIDCVFCQQHNERAREHIWPQWLQIFVGGSLKGLHTGTHLSTTDIISKRKQSGNSLVYGEVCAYCNSGWMNDMETAVAPIIKIVADGHIEKGEWDEYNSSTMAKWAFKTALMVNAGSNYRRLIPDEHYHYLYQNKVPPSHVTVDVAIAHPVEETLEWVQDQFYGVLKPEQSDQFKPTHLQKAYKITLSIKALLLRVNYWPYEKCEVFPNSGNDFHRIWPFQKTAPFNFTDARTNMRKFYIGIIVYDD